MPRTEAEALELAKDVHEIRQGEEHRLQTVYEYLRDDPDERRLGGLPTGAPPDVVRLARMSRVNMVKYVVSARVQGLYVDGFQTPASPDNLEQWQVWQRNRFDARQIGVHRAGLSYGASYAIVLPGDPVPVIRGAGPRQVTVAYGDDDDWPRAALWKRRGDRWRLIDDEAVYELTKSGSGGFELQVDGIRPHEATYDGAPVCPVVRYRDTDDLDDPVRGIVQPLFPLQDQINITTFGLQVAQHYGAFRQRYILGWLAKSEEAALKTGASRVLTFEDGPDDIKVGEFAQTELRGYIESRESTIRHLATVSQTPAHELVGELINLSAEALEAARASHQAAVDENRLVMGEAHEQTLNLAGEMSGQDVDPTATVIWRDTRVRSLAEAAVAFGALVQQLGVPPRELWKRIPGIAQHEVEAWTAAADAMGDPIAELTRILDSQSNGAGAAA
jgi:hypothetical protein